MRFGDIDNNGYVDIILSLNNENSTTTNPFVLINNPY